MNVSGLNNSVRDLLASRLDPASGRPVEQQPQPAAPARTLSLVPSARPAAAGDVAQGATAAPEGTDPALWSVLTGDERAFFAKHISSGPLTYSKMMLVKHPASPAAPSIRGGRIDVRA